MKSGSCTLIESIGSRLSLHFLKVKTRQKFHSYGQLYFIIVSWCHPLQLFKNWPDYYIRYLLSDNREMNAKLRQIAGIGQQKRLNPLIRQRPTSRITDQHKLIEDKSSVLSTVLSRPPVNGLSPFKHLDNFGQLTNRTFINQEQIFIKKAKTVFYHPIFILIELVDLYRVSKNVLNPTVLILTTLSDN